MLLITCIFSSLLLAAFDLTNERPGEGPLGVSLDYALATQGPGVVARPDVRRRTFPITVFSSYIKFKEDVSQITNGQLVQIALDGYEEMERNAHEQYKAERQKDIPGVMTVLAYGNEIILGSSQKGGTSFTYDYGMNPVHKSLRECMGTTKHRTSGKCGEQLVAHMYYRVNPEGAPGSIALPERNARAITVGLVESDTPVAMNPCGKEGSLGCKTFVSHQKLHYLQKNTRPEKYDLDSLAGGVVEKKQLSICGNVDV
ncbi:hypothetical protein Purlil1_12086 [Purpureocillium lilacinum]|uniref:Uncharacterized protein n=1 Tax=Purpureocillium lilacinum TaxID=33203 RepID=A0ABR0BHV1_PURLI|nr:hypothetical protein Purlil1_12086 [Purpureocillium lilacinum]